ncbi:MAG: hypothetical protein EX263_09700 [Flavobacteriaceae bacterium]|nr:hypothetical protein [Flavobacteriaceae bacterium]RZW45611.1 MAG: hypothetical protein EX263_09700 [Flavobacteriaceae bacterium]
MNPSTAGWIKKLLSFKELDQSAIQVPLSQFYFALRSCGFIYGSNLMLVNSLLKDDDLTDEERCKINLILAFLVAHHENRSVDDFASSLLGFYKAINEYKISLFDDILGEKDANKALEKVIHKRIQIDDNIISKSFNYFITNALLFLDVLAYKDYLKHNSISKENLRNYEAKIETIVVKTLSSKQQKSEYDQSLLKLFESSMRFQDHQPLSYQDAIGRVKNEEEAQYLLDIACMSTWGDRDIDDNERYFLSTLGKDLNLKSKGVDESIAAVNAFFSKHKKDIALLSSKNVVKSFYDNSSLMVSKLISRNKKRLHKEIRESKDVVRLLSQSTVRDLTAEEQKQLQSQLLDIFKTIPSLAIFMLPGGMLLLPLVVKFIPKLLPSAFDDNRIEDD